MHTGVLKLVDNIQWTLRSFHQHCGHLQGYKTQGLDTSEVYDERMKI